MKRKTNKLFRKELLYIMITMFPTIPVKIKPGTIMPKYAYEGDAGMDICATEDAILYPGETVVMKTGLSFEIPRGWVGYLHARSGTGTKGLVIKHGTSVIDSSYRGEVDLPLFNNNIDTALVIKKGDRVAQIVFQPVGEVTLKEVDNLNKTDRGNKGFGSSGIGKRL